MSNSEKLDIETLATAFLLLAGRYEKKTGVAAAHTVVNALSLAMREKSNPAAMGEALELIEEGYREVLEMDDRIFGEKINARSVEQNNS